MMPLRDIILSAPVSVDVLRGERRDREAVEARWRVIRRAWEEGHSKAAIARAINRDQSTVSHAIKVLSS